MELRVFFVWMVQTKSLSRSALAGSGSSRGVSGHMAFWRSAPATMPSETLFASSLFSSG